MATKLLAADDSRWRLFLERARHDTYHHPEYARVAGHYEGGEPVAFYADDAESALLMPLLVRELPPELGAPREWRDATSPYGYSGPIATPGADGHTIRCSLASLQDVARERSIVSAFIRMNPFCPVTAQAFEQIGTIVNHGPVVYVDLTKSLDQLWAETRSNHRRNITRLMQLGYSVEMNDWSTYPVFRELYRRTMQRRSASAFYYFSDEYFDELRVMLGDHLHLCTVRGPEGDIAASGLFMLADGIAEYHLGGTADDHFARAPSKLMFDFVRRWAKQIGASVLNLGGGVGGSAGPLHQFKTGFSQAQADFHTVRIVFDHEAYQRLVAASREIRSVEDAPDSFFPAYRRAYNDGDDA
jgi:hypothetical protein